MTKPTTGNATLNWRLEAAPAAARRSMMTRLREAGAVTCSECGHLHFEGAEIGYSRCPLAPDCTCPLDDVGDGEPGQNPKRLERKMTTLDAVMHWTRYQRARVEWERAQGTESEELRDWVRAFEIALDKRQ